MVDVLNTVTIEILPDPKQPPTRQIVDIPWFPGMTVLTAMMVGDAMFADTFTFRLVYRSFYGAWIDSIDGVDDKSDHYWMLYVNGSLSDYGVSDTILRASSLGSQIAISWRFENVQAMHPQLETKLRAVNRG